MTLFHVDHDWTREEKAYMKIKEGAQANVLRDLFRSAVKDQEEREIFIKRLLNKEQRRKNIRNIILGTPWNLLSNKLSNIIKIDKTNRK